MSEIKPNLKKYCFLQTKIKKKFPTRTKLYKINIIILMLKKQKYKIKLIFDLKYQEICCCLSNFLILPGNNVTIYYQS